MKKIYLVTFWVLSMYCAEAQFNSQFNRMPLFYPTDGTAYSDETVSIVDQNHIWVGTMKRASGLYVQTYSKAVKTTDGGNTWQFYTIPATGSPYISDVEAQSNDICYYLMDDINTAKGDVWKTVDGGTTWIKMTTTQFSGDYADFIHLFSNDSLVVVGDPLNGYFNIQISNDGGSTWSRVPQSNIPPPLTNESAVGGKWFSAIGNTIWFTSASGRCFKSIDRGNHWTVTDINSSLGFQFAAVAFSDLQHGIFYSAPTGHPYQYFKTEDGGSTWTSCSILPNLTLTGISSIPGISQGFILAASDKTTGTHSYIYFTNDFFTTLSLVDSVRYSNNRLWFKDASTGWMGAFHIPDSSIYKFNGVLVNVRNLSGERTNLEVFPNPSNYQTQIQFSKEFLNESKILKIYSYTGILMKEIDVAADVNQIELSTKGYSSGCYEIILISKSGRINATKWIVSH